MLVLEPLQAPVRLRVVLNEDEIPDLHHLRVVGVHQLDPRRLGPGRRRSQVYVHFRAGPAGPRVPHHPEVLLRRLIEHVLLRNRGLGTPEVVGLLVRLQLELVVPLVDGRIQAIRGQPPAVHQQFPRPPNGVGFEVVAEAPVAQHLEKRVMVRVVPHLPQVVVLPGHAQAFLRVDRPRVRALPRPQENVLELVHARIREEEGAVALRHERGARDNFVVPLREKLEKVVSNLLGGAARVDARLQVLVHRRRVLVCRSVR